MHMNRRQLLIASTTVGLALPGGLIFGAPAPKAKFTLDLCAGRIGITLGQNESIAAAAEYGFSSVEPLGSELAKMSDMQLNELRMAMTEKKIVWGSGGVPVLFHRDEARFQEALSNLPAIAKGYQRAGVTRTGTWISPSHPELTYLANFKQHLRRLREIAKVLSDHDLRFGLEYVGPKTSWSRNKHPFVHSMAETKELIADIGRGNVGYILDSWHWYTAGETTENILSLDNDDVVAVDLNDAPAGIPVEQQIDNRRALPMATGVIDLKGFLKSLVQIGYDGPIRAEPFSKELETMDRGAALTATAQAMKKSFALVQPD